MTTQRDRLAAVLAEFPLVPPDAWTRFSSEAEASLRLQMADALLARGVRVVDVETLAAAFHGITRTETFIAGDGEVAIGPRSDESFADAFLAALDREADVPFVPCVLSGGHVWSHGRCVREGCLVGGDR